MISETIGKVAIQRHDDINELVVEDYNLFNEYALYDAELGSLNDINKHFQKVDMYLANKKMEEALQARKNMNQAFFHVFQKNNFPQLQWVALLHSIEGVKIEDRSIDKAKEIIRLLSAEGLTQAKVLADVAAAKKKSAHN